MAGMAAKLAQKVMTNATERKDLPGPGRELYQLVRGGLVQRGFSIRAWAEANEFSENAVRYALHGLSDSDEARRIRTLAVRAAGLVESTEKD